MIIIIIIIIITIIIRRRMWDIKEVIVIPVVVGVLGAISAGFEKYIAAIVIEMRVERTQKTALLGTARILRLVLG